MEKQLRLTFRNQALRFCTLACFFSFSGLNNGFTTLVVSQGQIQSIEFTPILVARCAAAVNPLVWNRTFFRPLCAKIFQRSTQTISFASQRAVQQILLESNLMEIWVKSGLLKINIKSLAKISSDVHEKSTHAQGIASRKHPAEAAGPHISFSNQNVFIKDTPGYLKTDKKKTWKTGSLHGPPKFVSKIGVVPFADGRFGRRFNDFIGHVSWELKVWLSSSLSRGGGSLCLFHFHAFSNEITLPIGQGDFLFIRLGAGR